MTGCPIVLLTGFVAGSVLAPRGVGVVEAEGHLVVSRRVGGGHPGRSMYMVLGHAIVLVVAVLIFVGTLSLGKRAM